MDLSNAQRKKLIVGPGLMTENQYKQAMKVARQLPAVQIEKAWFKVTGEKIILPSSLVSLVIKARVIPPGAQNVPDVKDSDLEDIDPVEGDLDAQDGTFSLRIASKGRLPFLRLPISHLRSLSSTLQAIPPTTCRRSRCNLEHHHNLDNTPLP